MEQETQRGETGKAGRTSEQMGEDDADWWVRSVARWLVLELQAHRELSEDQAWERDIVVGFRVPDPDGRLVTVQLQDRRLLHLAWLIAQRELTLAERYRLRPHRFCYYQ